VVIVLALVVCFYVTQEGYSRSDTFRSQRYAKGFHGPGFTGGVTEATLLGGPPGIPKVFKWGGQPEVEGDPSSTFLSSNKDLRSDPASTTGYDQYSMYSAKVWPTTYQPVTNTCFDEYMKECSPKCNNIPDSRDCLQDCQVSATTMCSKKRNFPETVSHPF